MKKLHLLTLIASLAFTGLANAQTDPNIYFGFQAKMGTNTQDFVSGEIFGLTTGGSANPSKVVIFSDTGSGAGTQASIGTGLTADLTLTSHPSNTGSEVITLDANNHVTALNPNGGIYTNTEEWTDAGAVHQLGLDIVDTNGSYYFEGNDLIEDAPVTFSTTGPIAFSATPEPTAWALGLTAVALFVVLRRRATRS